jgi:cyclopropane fatty-acyl-phospholipid synthase-like methyltransferase
MPSASSAKLSAPSTQRNRDPILAVLQAALPERGRVLEIASGAGEHAIHVAAALPGIIWQPSDLDPRALASIAAWSEEAALPNLLPPLRLDASLPPWPGIAPASLDAIVSINMIHISPWASCEGLMAGAGAALKPGGLVYLYGPFRRDGQHTAPSNAAFDADLRLRDPRWGVRDLADVAAEAAKHGLTLEKTVEMPANNLSVLFRRGA